MMLLTEHADILILGLTIASIALLGFLVYFNNPKSITNEYFLGFTLLAIGWGAVNFIAYQVTSESQSLWLWRLVLFSAVWFCFAIFDLAMVFPRESFTHPKWYSRVLLPFVTIVSLLTLTPLVFAQLLEAPRPGFVPEIENGPLIPLFGITVAGLVLAAVYFFVRKARGGKEERNRVFLIMIGTAITFALLIIFNFLLPTSFKIFSFIPYGAVFLLPFIACTAYSIARYHLFNARVITAQVFSFLLCISTLVQVIFSASPFELIFRVSVFALVLALSVLFVKSIIREVAQREQIEVQKKALEEANHQQETLLHFISHEIKGYLTKSEAGFASIVEGDYGDVSENLKSMAFAALHEVRKGVRTVMDILDASNFKKGTVSYANTTFDFKTMVEQVIKEVMPSTEEKKLSMEFTFSEGDYTFTGDEEKIRKHAIRNLIDNAVRYTPAGAIQVHLQREPNLIRFSVKDSGVGITDEDKQHLFTEGGHGKNSIKVNVHSTGYGLYIAKQVIEAHKGKIWADSDGQGLGSTFTLELPLNSAV